MALQFLNEIPEGIFTDFKQIGSGSCSTIFSATHIKTNSQVALKVSIKNDDEEYMKLLYQELNIQKSLNHPFICRYFTDLETEHLIIIVLELIEGINLLDHVNKNRGLPINEAQNIFAQLIIAVEYLHSECNIAHRDLKLENIMLDNYGHIRLFDFGFSSPKLLMSTICGSIPYCAPEVLECQEYTKEADIWSMGVILYCLISDHLPFYHQNIFKLANIICTHEPSYPSVFDPMSRDLISRLLIKDPTQRITINEMKSHAFISHASIFQIDYKQIFSPIKIEEEADSEIEAEIQPNEEKRCSGNNQSVTFSQFDFSDQTENTFKFGQSNQIRARRFSQISNIGQTKSVAINANQIKFSNSNPNIGKDKFNSTYALLARQRPKLLQCSSISMNSPQFSKLQKIITLESDNVDHLIISRKDFPSNLNKLIEASLLVSSHENNNIHIKRSHIKLRSSLPIHFQVSNNIHKNIQNHVLFAQAPVIAKPI